MLECLKKTGKTLKNVIFKLFEYDINNSAEARTCSQHQKDLFY